MKKILITGGNGFFGHHFCEHILKNTDWNIYVVDRLSYASSGYDRLREVDCYDNKRIRHFSHDFTLPITEGLLKELSDINYIAHIGAETHVDNSIVNPEIFIKANVVGTMNMLQFARKCPQLEKFFYMGTDEVFGPAPRETVPNGYNEWDRYNSTNPYSASKAGGEELCLAWANCYNVPIIIGHTMNLFGERQHPEKFIPKCINKILAGEEIQIHSTPDLKTSGSRFWIHCRNASEAVLFLLNNGRLRDKYNIVGEKEVTNLDMALFIGDVLDMPVKYRMVDFHSSRPGHDTRYGLNGDKLKSMGYKYPKLFEESLTKTIEWTLDNPRWLNLEVANAA